MRREELNRIIQQDLEHISSQAGKQNELRMIYNLTRRKVAWRSKTKEEVLEYCIERVFGSNPENKPFFDRNYFKIA